MTAAPVDVEEPPRRGPGRPRTEGVDERIIDAAVGLVDAGRPVTVAAIVRASGVSRAALYRRWPSLTDLVADALDRGRAGLEIPTDGDLKQAILEAYFTHARESRGSDYPERRFRMRLKLALEDRSLQRAYWDSHVSRRRHAMTTLLQVGIERGELRDDLDIEACIDLINGVVYYQYVVRGVSYGDAEAAARMRAAVETVWRGMLA